MRTHWERVIKPLYERSIDGLIMSGNKFIDLPINRFVLEEHRRIYRFGREFAEALSHCDLNVSTGNINRTDTAICIEFLDVCAYIAVEKGHISVTVFQLGRENLLVGDGNIYGFVADFKSAEYTVRQIIDASINSATGTISATEAKAVSSVFLALLYLDTGTPDLRELRPVDYGCLPTRRERDRLRQKHEDEPQVPVTLVGFDWRKPRVFGVDSTHVSGHFRWQPHGTKRGQVKLIWINEHLRTYNKHAAPKDENRN